MALTQVQGGMLAGSTNTTTTIQSNGTTAITIDSSQDVGIGNASPYAKLQTYQSSSTLPVQYAYRGTQGSDGSLPTTYGFPYLQIGRTEFRANSLQTIGFGYLGADGNNPPAEIGYLTTSTSGETLGDLVFATRSVTTNTAASERMRIFSTGQVAIGTNNFNTGFGGAFTVLASTSNGSMNGIQALTSTGSYALIVANTNGSGGNLVWWAYNGSNVGTVTTNGSSTSYNTTSDYRLKENVAPMTGALATVAQLKPVTYTWKSNGSDGQGFIAHELQAVVPDAVSGEKDAIETYKDEDGNEQTRIKPQGVDTSFLVATLTAAIQELNAKVEAQAAEIAALKVAK
jgi:hypothetical protein